MTAAFELKSPSWKSRLAETLSSPSAHQLSAFLEAEKRLGAVYPSSENLFRALELTAFEEVRLVLLGQDPYHGPGQAHGLSFSVQDGTPIPPSLRNIHKEIERDLGRPARVSGSLVPWARQGVLLLNSTLTVAAGKAGSHQGRGWEAITDRIVSLLAGEREGLVFLLWGSHAQKKASHVSRTRHLVLEAPHPSPLSAHRGFLGCGHFSKANEWLVARGQAPIDW